MSSYKYYTKYILHKDDLIIQHFLWQIENKYIVFDEDNILMVKQHDPAYPTYVYNAIGIANYGLIRYTDLIENTNKLTSKVDSRTAINRQVLWLIKNRTDKKDMSLWYFNYPFKSHGCKPPWKSGMAQGLILSLLLRMHHLTKNEEYTELAERVANSMRTPTDEGGFLYIDNDDNYWYQEYMGNCGYVLNGFIFALWGIYDYYLYSEDEEYKMIFDKCIDTLKNNLKKYDLRMGLLKWTIYDLKDKNPVDLGYHRLHVSLLKDLYGITNKKFLLTYANHWERYIKQPNLLLVNMSRRPLALLKILRSGFHER